MYVDECRDAADMLNVYRYLRVIVDRAFLLCELAEQNLESLDPGSLHMIMLSAGNLQKAIYDNSSCKGIAEAVHNLENSLVGLNIKPTRKYSH